MKLNYPKNWFEQRIEREGHVAIGAGIPPWLVTPAATPHVKLYDRHLAFGQFVSLWRRYRGWNADQLAVAAGLDREEVVQIECDPQCQPESEVILKLAAVFGVPLQALTELTRLQASQTPNLREEPIRLAARSESLAALSEVERQTFEAFATALSEGPGANRPGRQ